DGCTVFAPARKELPDPLASSIRVAYHPAQRRPRSMDEEFAQIAIAAFANPQQARLTSSRVLAWHQTQPGSKLPAVFERAGIADGGHQGRRAQGPNPRDRHQPLTLGMRRGQRFELLLVIGQLL